MRSHPVKCSSSNEISARKIGNHCKNANAHTLEKQELVIGKKNCTYPVQLHTFLQTEGASKKRLWIGKITKRS